MEASKKFQSLHSKPCLMQIENILETILTNRILKPLTEYELIKILQQEHFLLTDFSMKKANELFAAHFILFHTLYRLRKRWIYHQSYLLEISSLKIQLLPFVGVKGHAIDKQDLLQIYYLDINNLHQTTEQDVVELLRSFWIKMEARSGEEEALNILSLEQGTTWSDIKKRYRTLVQTHHPDKGGCPEKFHRYQNAMETLRSLNIKF